MAKSVDLIPVHGNVIVIAWPSRRILWRGWNTITMAGRDCIAEFLADQSPTPPSHLALSDTAIASTESLFLQSALRNEYYRVALTSQSVQASDVARLVALMSAGLGTGTIRQMGLFDAGVAGNLLFITEPSPAIVKGVSDIVGVYWYLSSREGGTSMGTYAPFARERLEIEDVAVSLTAATYAPSDGTTSAQEAEVTVMALQNDAAPIHYTMEGTAPTATGIGAPAYPGAQILLDSYDAIAGFKAIRAAPYDGGPASAWIEVVYKR